MSCARRAKLSSRRHDAPSCLQMSNVPWEVFRGDPRPDDIRQGIVGNCWFVCALSALAEAPENLRRIVLTRSYSHAGAYQARVMR